ncbi:hypothetical protein [Chelatococcus asaccharovorans]|uniref:Uncharacterized protein n=1 Tax=Chelatococcus asaccharovorans TaxID=28210 RepID=A0A2V3UDE0_9HYPH|nr:hypothetical protein [Chelatococcus asaccharovorans]MBS7702336.1 hypothetical protein [Chelatococcus asaccharovorans]PXW56462.1 hypothetical protein C7450_108212 [Chelatococcus asaccharovorans]
MKAFLLTSVTARLCCAAAMISLALPLAQVVAAVPGPTLAQFEGRGINDRAPRAFDHRDDNRERNDRREMRERPTRYEEPRRGDRLDRQERMDRQERQERKRPAIIISPQGFSPFQRDRDPGQR